MNFLTVNLMRVACCITWAGFVISMAAPANALAMKDATTGTGSYASCGAANTPFGLTCGNYMFNYTQNMKFIMTSCSAGSCSQSGDVRVENVYPVGRKTVTVNGTCFSSYIVSLGSCAC
jgi:hypothetical protein